MKSEIKTYYTLIVKESEGRGRGVFTEEDIPKEVLVELSPIIEIKKTDENTIKYVYMTSENTKKYISLGYAGLYNHSDEPNITSKVNPKDNTIVVKSKRDIKKGEELFINYGNRLDYFI